MPWSSRVRTDASTMDHQLRWIRPRASALIRRGRSLYQSLLPPQMKETIGFPVNSRHLLLQAKQQSMGSMEVPSPSQDLCSNPRMDTPCSTAAASTLIVIILGMSAMMLLVLIAIVLLCRSHIMYRQRMEHSRQGARVAGEESGGAGGEGPPSTLSAVPDESAGSCDDVVLVLLPGEKYPVMCARVSPLHSAIAETKKPCSDVNKDNP